MTVLSFGPNDCRIVQADDDACIHVAAEHAHESFVKVTASDGSTHLFPFARLEPGERAVYENAELFKDIKEALEVFVPGGGISADWLFDDDE